MGQEDTPLPPVLPREPSPAWGCAQGWVRVCRGGSRARPEEGQGLSRAGEGEGDPGSAFLSEPLTACGDPHFSRAAVGKRGAQRAAQSGVGGRNEEAGGAQPGRTASAAGKGAADTEGWLAVLPPSRLRGTEEHGAPHAPPAPRLQPRSGGGSSAGSRRGRDRHRHRDRDRDRDRDRRGSAPADLGRGGPWQGGG